MMELTSPKTVKMEIIGHLKTPILAFFFNRSKINFEIAIQNEIISNNR
jgi:hypothetical protein